MPIQSIAARISAVKYYWKLGAALDFRALNSIVVIPVIADFGNEEDIIVVQDAKPIAKLVPVEPQKLYRKAGSAKGMIWMSPDFDEPLEDFKDYM